MNSYTSEYKDSGLELCNRCSSEIFGNFKKGLMSLGNMDVRKVNHFCWDKFINQLLPVLRYLTSSFREGDWNLHLSSVCRVIPFCFSVGHVSYK